MRKLALDDEILLKIEKPARYIGGEVNSVMKDKEKAGIRFAIISNNRSGRRVTDFCASLGVPYVGHAGKPSPRGLEEAMARIGAKRQETAMLGDKLLTDMLAARRAGVLALMVEPVGGAVTAWQKVLHALQSPWKAACRRKMKAGR